MQYLVHAGHFGHRFGHDGGGWWLGGLLGLLLFAAVVTLAVLLGMRLAGRPRHWGGPHMGHGHDQALAQLRLRYAQGQVSREEYLRTSADLGAPLPPEPPPAA